MSNASVWDTQRLLPDSAPAAADWTRAAADTTPIESFMHLHLGIDATDLPRDLECHHLFVHDWADVTTHQNVCIASIPTVFDPALAPEGKATVHAYTAANEPWELWDGMDQRSEEYRALKRERAEVLWRSLERVRRLCSSTLRSPCAWNQNVALGVHQVPHEVPIYYACAIAMRMNKQYPL